MTPPEYTVGKVKQNVTTLAIAVRTSILNAEGDKDWGVMTVDQGGTYVPWETVQDWRDLT